ncbi:hypothetical protein B0O95_101226 [Mycetohabitans endofungorum]|uniref:Uncharacterized protein n=1 Tax=Mycetohabitans endofungorum TaxID=417203 RepID=A0A2P5KEJ6_9BURK|nr:hypothetical protein B0O95_101226 [Mycetohabitans endofungorum]
MTSPLAMLPDGTTIRPCDPGRRGLYLEYLYMQPAQRGTHGTGH